MVIVEIGGGRHHDLQPSRLPIVLRRRGFGGRAEASRSPAADLGGFVLGVRRVAIVVVHPPRPTSITGRPGEAALAAIGLLSFAAVAQIAPAFFGGLFWSRGTALGASAGLVTGFAVWAYTLLLPSLALEGGFWADLVKRGSVRHGAAQADRAARRSSCRS